MDAKLSGQFINATEFGYGTRCTTTLWCSEAGDIEFAECTYDEAGNATGEVVEQFKAEVIPAI